MMNLKECIKKKGLHSSVESFKRWQAVNVGFMDNNKLEDEVQFDIRGAGIISGTEELAKLFSDFCNENGLETNTVLYVAVVASADTYEELELLTA